MCLVTFMKDSHPDYPLIFLTNRDESYNRPAVPIHRWTDFPLVTAGIDLEAKGTWLGYTKNGKFIAILNNPFTNWTPCTDKPRSRGKLLRDYLTSEITVSEFEDNLRKTRKRYNGYHLIFGTFHHLKYYSNVEGIFQNFEAGIHTLSNTMDDLSMHRKNYSSTLLKNYVDDHMYDLKLNEIIELMKNKESAEKLEDYPKELDRKTAKKRSAIFIQGKDFGTVGTTAILLDKEGRIKVKEVKYDQEKITETTTIEQYLNL